MAASYNTRYGYSASVDESNLVRVMDDLIEELRTEESDEPDDEHTQVSIGNEHYAVTAQVSGLITFDNMDSLEERKSHLPEIMYLRDISDEDLKTIWRAVTAQNEEAILAFSWSDIESLPPYVNDFYRDVP